MCPRLFYDLFENIFPLSRNYHQDGCNSGTESACTVKFRFPKKVTVRPIDALQFTLMRLSTIRELPMMMMIIIIIIITPKTSILGTTHLLRKH